MLIPASHRVRFAAARPNESAAARMESVCALADAARELKRAQLRLSCPEASQEQVESLLVRWLRQRPGAEQGDGVGRVGRWPRDHS